MSSAHSGRITFRAWDVRGNLVLETWTDSHVTFAAERAAFQSRLNRGELGWVEIIYPDRLSETMHPQT